MSRFQSERVWIAGALVVALLMALVGYFMLIGPQRTRTGAVRQDVSAAAFQETTLQSRIISLTAQSKRIATYRTDLAHARQALPASNDLTATPQLLRTLAAEASATSTSITDLTVGDPAAVTATPPVVPAGTATSSATPAAPAATTAPELSSIALGATVTGAMVNLNRFLTSLQSTQPRALLVTAVTLSTGAGAVSGTTASLKLTMTAFVRAATTRTGH